MTSYTTFDANIQCGENGAVSEAEEAEMRAMMADAGRQAGRLEFLTRLADAAVDRLDRIRRVDRLADLRRLSEKHRQPLPTPPRGGETVWVLIHESRPRGWLPRQDTKGP